jgi:hypothetical protein
MRRRASTLPPLRFDVLALDPTLPALLRQDLKLGPGIADFSRVKFVGKITSDWG